VASSTQEKPNTKETMSYLPTTLRLLRNYKQGIVKQLAIIAKHDSGYMTNRKDSDFWVATQKLREVNKELEYLEEL
jgi:hypothetical protein